MERFAFFFFVRLKVCRFEGFRVQSWRFRVWVLACLLLPQCLKLLLLVPLKVASVLAQPSS